MSDERREDELDVLNKEVERLQFYGEAKPHRIAEWYESVAAILTDVSRKNQALSKAARYYLDIGYNRYFDNKRKALQIYEQIGDREKAEKIRKILKDSQRNEAIGILENILNKHNDCMVRFRELKELPADLAEAGFPEIAKKYEKIVQDITEFALGDIKAIKALEEETKRNKGGEENG